MTSAPTATPLAEARPILLTDWREREAAHTARVTELTAPRRYRAERRLTDPVEDFLWDYYSLKPRHLTRWHHGAGFSIPDDGDLGWRTTARWARWLPAVDGETRALTLDTEAYLRDRGSDVGRLETLLEATAGRAPRFACFGWHEWAMVYRQGEHRHPLPLRLGQVGTDAAVEAADLKCTHYDAFRFYSPAARPLNAQPLTRETQPEFEQPGCLHANMDLLKAALLLGPACPGELLLDAFELARRIRILDMAASPYDCSELGLEPVRIETPAGRAEYVARQREFAAESAPVRERLLEVIGRVGVARAQVE
ncbi:MAG: 3-methyladenine DNA glycosylase [bacterium]|nr:3-methyladenine DNA glycosylase [bacterium]